MYKYNINSFFVFLAFNFSVSFGETVQRNFFFFKKEDNKIAKDDNNLFKLLTESPISCLIACKSNDICHGFFYERTTKQCTGTSLGASHELNELEDRVGSSFYQEISRKNLTRSTSWTTTGRSTSLKVTSSSDTMETSMTSSPQQTSTLPSDLLDDIWAEWNSSEYKIFTGPDFYALNQTQCCICDANNETKSSYCTTSFRVTVQIIVCQATPAYVTLFLTEGFPSGYIGFFLDIQKREMRYHPSGHLAKFKDPFLERWSPSTECVILDARGVWHSIRCFRQSAATKKT